MSRSVFQPEWRTQSRRKRRFYARYMGWLEKTGFVVVGLLVAGFVGSFFYEIDEWVSADEVEIVAEEVSVPARHERKMEVRVADGAEVRAGQILAVDLPPKDGMVFHNRPIVAPVAGIVTLIPATDGSPPKIFAVIRNYDRLFVLPKLAGKSIAKADVGQPAEISNIRIQSEGGTVLRARLDGKTATTRSLVGVGVREALNTVLRGKSVASREDVPLKIEGVDEVEIEAGLRTAQSSENGSAAFDPGPEFKLFGKVREGKPTISAQLGDLPPEVRAAATAELRKKLVGTNVDFTGEGRRIEDLIDPRFVVRLTASEKVEGKDALPAASLKRNFEAKIELENVPADLVERLKAAHRQNQKVTARVQVRTGSKPIAYFLLRRS